MRVVPSVNPEVAYADSQEELRAEISYLRHKVVIQETTINYLNRQAQEDVLTGLLNRRAFDDRLRQAFMDYNRYGRKAALLMVDVNDFKCINDTLGHLAGDAVLKHIAQFLKSELRETDIIARLGGDEFCIILQEATQCEAKLKAQSLADAMAKCPCRWAEKDVYTSLSIGACSFDKAKDKEDLIAHADEQMYAMKSTKSMR